MRIESINVKNLFSFDDFKIRFDNGKIAIIFGPNNVGKTNLFRVLKLMKNIIDNKISMSDLERYLHNKNLKSAKIEIDVIFEKSDKDIIAKFLRIFFKINAPDLMKLCNSLKLNFTDAIINYFSSGSYVWECSELKCYSPYFLLRLKSLEEGIDKIIQYLKEHELFEVTPDLIDHSRVIHELDRKIEVIEITNELKNIIVSSINSIIGMYKKSGKLVFSTLINNKNGGLTLIKNKSLENDDIKISIEKFIKEIGKYEDIFKRLKMDKDILSTFIILLALHKLQNNKMSIYLKDILEYSKNNPWDKELIEDLIDILSSFGINCEEAYKIGEISLNDILLKIYKNNIIFYEDYLPSESKVSIPDHIVFELISGLNDNSNQKKSIKSKILELFKACTTKDDMYLGISSISSEKWVSRYLFYLKNNVNIKLRKKYLKIKETFEYLFNGENLSFDVVLVNNSPEVMIYSNNMEIPLNIVGLGIKKILEILALILGYEEKVILLDTPFSQLHPKYQKRLSKILENTNNINSQLLIILQSPYIVSNKLVYNAFRFYKPKNSTKYKCVGDIFKELEKTLGIISLDKTTRNILLSDAIILLSSNLRDIPLFDLSEYSNIPIDEYDIEIIHPPNNLSFEKYHTLLEYSTIPYIIIFKSWTLYNLYEKIKDEKGKVKYKLLEKGKYNKEIEELINFFKNKHPFWMTKEEFDRIIGIYIKTLEIHREKLIELGHIYLSSKEDIIKYCIEPLRKELENILRKKLFIFTVPEDFIINTTDLKNSKIDKEKYIIHNYIGYKKEVLREFKEFFEYFVKFHNL